jgi:hypothetical protein
VKAGADHLGRLRVDQCLEHQLDALADHLDVAAGADHLQQLGKVIMGEGHLVVSFACPLVWITLRITPWPTYVVDPSVTPLDGTPTSGNMVSRGTDGRRELRVRMRSL